MIDVTSADPNEWSFPDGFWLPDDEPPKPLFGWERMCDAGYWHLLAGVRQMDCPVCRART